MIACAGGTGKGVTDCLLQFERGLTQMGMRVYDRIPVVRLTGTTCCPRCARPAGPMPSASRRDSICTIDAGKEKTHDRTERKLPLHAGMREAF
jgi:hypothetical protein